MDTLHYMDAEIGLRFPGGTWWQADDALGRTRQAKQQRDSGDGSEWMPPQGELGEIDRIYERRVEARCTCQVCRRYKRSDLSRVFPDDAELLSKKETETRLAFEAEHRSMSDGPEKNRLKYEEHVRRSHECDCTFCRRYRTGYLDRAWRARRSGHTREAIPPPVSP